MGFTAAKCTNCGAAIEVDATKEAGICTHCGTAFITEKVINHYNSFVTQNITKNIYGGADADEYIDNGNTFLQLKEFDKAEQQFEKAIEAAPADAKARWGAVMSLTKNLTDPTDVFHESYWEKCKALASPETLSEYEEKYADYAKAVLAHRAEERRIHQLWMDGFDPRNKKKSTGNKVATALVVLLGVAAFIVGIILLKGAFSLGGFFKTIFSFIAGAVLTLCGGLLLIVTVRNIVINATQQYVPMNQESMIFTFARRCPLCSNANEQLGWVISYRNFNGYNTLCMACKTCNSSYETPVPFERWTRDTLFYVFEQAGKKPVKTVRFSDFF